jgi:hypothetical protein
VILLVLILAIASFITLWIAGAIYYDVCEEGRYARLVAGGWVGAILLLFIAWQPLWQPFAVLLGLAVPFLAWWLRLKPSHDRDWEPAVAMMPRVHRTDELVTIENFRNFDYPAQAAYTPRYESRTFHLANLKGVDVVFFYWGSRWMSHPVLVFDLGPDGRICFSIEVRYRRGKGYAFLPSLYRRQELIIVAADERDVILRRTRYDGEQTAYLYHINATMEELRGVFLDFVAAITRLSDEPRWYHGLCGNCTTTFYRFPHARLRLDWRILANARLDSALYDSGRLDRSLPFAELRRCAYLNEIANDAPAKDFGDYIRQELRSRRRGK